MQRQFGWGKLFYFEEKKTRTYRILKISVHDAFFLIEVLKMKVVLNSIRSPFTLNTIALIIKFIKKDIMTNTIRYIVYEF